MGGGKLLAIVSGILVLLATFLFNWGGDYQNGLVVIPAFMGLLSDLSLIGILNIIFVILALISGVLILIGAKVRALAIIGAILPILIGLILLLPGFGLNIIPEIVNDYIGLSNFEDSWVLVPGYVPLTIIPAYFSIGLVLLFCGGILGLISGIMGRD